MDDKIKRLGRKPQEYIDIACLVLSGATMESVGQMYGLTRERIRQITNKYCRIADGILYKQLKTTRVKVLRMYAEDFHKGT